MVLRDVLTSYFAERDLADRTREWYRHECNRWERVTGNPDLSAVDTPLLLEYRQHISAQVQPPTVNAALRAVRCLLSAAGVGCSVRYVREQRIPKRVYSLVHLERVYLATEAASWPQQIDPAAWWRCLFVLAYCTGLRRSDLFRLTWDDYDSEEQVLQFSAAKTGKWHEIPVHPVLSSHLRRLPRATREILPLVRNWRRFRGELRAIAQQAAVPHLTLKQLRALAGTQFELAHPGAGALLLGHSLGRESTTFRHYVPPVAVLRQACDRLEIPAAFSSAPASTQRTLF